MRTSPTRLLLAVLILIYSSSTVFAKEKIEIGTTAPEMIGINQSGKTVNLGEDFKTGKTVIFFFPKAFTPGCTKQACSLRDSFRKLKDKGVKVYGVSSDSVETQKKFHDEHKLPYDLIADPEKKVSEVFGVPTTLGYMDRQAFLISEGKVVWIDRDAATDKQADDVLKALEQLPK